MKINEKENNVSNKMEHWKLAKDFGIVWDIEQDKQLPHMDEIEMSGCLVSVIVAYGVNSDGRLVLNKKIVWPTLRKMPNDTLASLIKEYGLETTPEISVDGIKLIEEKPFHIVFDGILTIKSRTDRQLEITRSILPSADHRAVIERFELKNTSDKEMLVRIAPPQITDIDRGASGVYVLEVTGSLAEKELILTRGEQVVFSLFYSGRKLLDQKVLPDAEDDLKKRRDFVRRISEALRFETPDPVLKQAFDFAKIRTAESIFMTSLGLMHCPGGGVYYAAIWANDQAEYSGPFFPFLGDATGNEAALNGYRLFRPFMGPDYHFIPISIKAEGMDSSYAGGDRGDAAMYAYGASRFALSTGDLDIAEELWPDIEWCLEYCFRRITPEGVIASEFDELEGRFPCGNANLSTSCLAYGAMRLAAILAKELGKKQECEYYNTRADMLHDAIEKYFGANVEGFDTYRYYDGNDILRSWICLPLTMGIMERKEGTLAALFSSGMWTENGLLTQSGDATFWDRSTLYGLRGVLASGELNKGMSFFCSYSRKRLLGDHVPYPVEAYPEGNKRHLSAESALYCRVITEGLFGITPTGIDSFTCIAQLPSGWDSMALRSIMAFGREFDLLVERAGEKLMLSVILCGKKVFENICESGKTVEIKLPK